MSLPNVGRMLTAVHAYEAYGGVNAPIWHRPIHEFKGGYRPYNTSEEHFRVFEKSFEAFCDQNFADWPFFGKQTILFKATTSHGKSFDIIIGLESRGPDKYFFLSNEIKGTMHTGGGTSFNFHSGKEKFVKCGQFSFEIGGDLIFFFARKPYPIFGSFVWAGVGIRKDKFDGLGLGNGADYYVDLKAMQVYDQAATSRILQHQNEVEVRRQAEEKVRSERFAAEQRERERREANEIAAQQAEKQRQFSALQVEQQRQIAEQQRIEAERQRREAAEAARKKAEEDAFWNSPEGMKVKAAQMMADIEQKKAIDAANIRIMEQERIAEIAAKMRREEREEQEDLINKVKDL